MSERLPNFIVVGAPKCGTTSLYHYLGQHPQIFLPARKELHYFSYRFMEKLLSGPGDRNILATSCRTFAEYAAYFSPAGEQKALGDISPSYFYFVEVCQEIRARLGIPKIIIMLRDPVEKAFSQYMHLIRDGRETLDFNAALEQERRRIEQGYAAMWRYAESSLYAGRIRRFMEEFGRDQVKVIFFDDLVEDSPRVLRETFEFLDVDPGVQVDHESVYNRSGVPRSRWMANLISKPNVITSIARSMLPLSVTGRVKDALQRVNTGNKLRLDAQSRDFLRSYFAADLAELAELLGRPVPWRAAPAAVGSMAEG